MDNTFWTDELIEEFALKYSVHKDYRYLRVENAREKFKEYKNKYIKVENITHRFNRSDMQVYSFVVDCSERITFGQLENLKSVIEKALNVEGNTVGAGQELASNTRHIFNKEAIDSRMGEKDYEILKCEFIPMGIIIDTHPLKKDNWDEKEFKIYSVKRLSDREVFSIGDKFTLYPGIHIYEIESFLINGNIICAIQNNKPNGAKNIPLIHLIKINIK